MNSYFRLRPFQNCHGNKNAVCNWFLDIPYNWLINQSSRKAIITNKYSKCCISEAISSPDIIRYLTSLKTYRLIKALTFMFLS